MATLTKKRIENIVYLTAEVKERVRLFHRDMEEYLKDHLLPVVPWKEHNVLILWNEIRYARGLAGYSDDELYEVTLSLFNAKKKEISEQVKLDRTSRIVNWYQTYEVPYLSFGKHPVYIPTPDDYDYYFRLKGTEFDEFDCNFYTLVHKLFKYQATKYRKQILPRMLQDPKILEQVEHSNFVVPIQLQFILNTTQVYNYYINSKLNKTVNKDKVFAQVEKLIKEEGITVEEALKRAVS